MILKLKRTPGIYLIGFMGSGKSTVGRMLADQIGWRFADIDDDVEAAAKTSITELFTERGEEEFRRFESEAIRQRVRRIQSGHPMVLALGGGAFLVVADTLARTLLAPTQLPVGVLTAFIGVPTFLWLLLRHARRA